MASETTGHLPTAPEALSLLATITRPHTELLSVFNFGHTKFCLGKYQQLFQSYLDLAQKSDSDPSKRQTTLTQLLQGIAYAAATSDYLSCPNETPKNIKGPISDIGQFVTSESYKLITYADSGEIENLTFTQDIGVVLSDPENINLVLRLFNSHIVYQEPFDCIEYLAGILIKKALLSPAYQKVISSIEQNLESNLEVVTASAKSNLAHACSSCISQLLEPAVSPDTDKQATLQLTDQIASLNALRFSKTLQSCPETADTFPLLNLHLLAALIKKLTPMDEDISPQLLNALNDITDVFTCTQIQLRTNAPQNGTELKCTAELLAQTQTYLLKIASQPKIDGMTTAGILSCYAQLDAGTQSKHLAPHRQEPLSTSEAFRNLAMALEKTNPHFSTASHLSSTIAHQISEIGAANSNLSKQYHALLGELWVLIQPHSIPNPQTLTSINMYFEHGLAVQLSLSSQNFSHRLIENLDTIITTLGHLAITTDGSPDTKLDQSQLIKTLGIALTTLNKAKQKLDLKNRTTVIHKGKQKPKDQRRDLIVSQSISETPPPSTPIDQQQQIDSLIQRTKTQLTLAATLAPLNLRKLAIKTLAPYHQKIYSLINKIPYWSSRASLVTQILLDNDLASLFDYTEYLLKHVHLPITAKNRVTQKISRFF